MLNVILNVIMLNVIMLNVIMLNVIMLSVEAPKYLAVTNVQACSVVILITVVKSFTRLKGPKCQL